MANNNMAVFLDRDGTIIEDRGDLASPADIVFLPDAAEALAKLQEHFKLFIVTNQTGIATGAITAEQAMAVSEAVVAFLVRAGARIERVFTCPHRKEENCVCRKPSPYFLRCAAEEYGLDLTRSYMIGDHPHDVACIEQVGGHGVYVCTGHGSKHLAELPLGKIALPSIVEAVDWILATAVPGYCCKEDIDAAARIIAAGGIVAFPTETVYGLGADAFNAEAVARIFAAKGRPYFDPLIVHIASPDWLPLLTTDVPPAAQRLAERFWPGPLTLVLPKQGRVPDIVTAGLPSVALRIPRHPVAQALLHRCSTPLAAPSANRFGSISPTIPQHVVAELSDRVDFILDSGPCPLGVESTVISFVEGDPLLLRPGGTPLEEIEAVIGQVRLPDGAETQPAAPGMLPRHYAPRTLLVFGDVSPADCQGRVGLLAFTTPPADAGFAAVEVLSPSGRLEEAAANLYGALRRLDALGLTMIVAQPLPEYGLGRAINDRLRRASSSQPTRL